MLGRRHSKLHGLLTIFTVVVALCTLSSLSQFVAYAQSTPSISINDGAACTNSTEVTLTISAAADAVEMQFSNDNAQWSEWETYATSKNWSLTTVEEVKTVYVEIKDSTGQILSSNDTIALDVTPPEVSVFLDWVSYENREVYFDGSYSTDNYGIASYSWNFGDGSNGTGVTTTHTYSESGNYTGTLVVKDVAGNIGGTYFYLTIPDKSQATPTPAPTATPAPTPSPTPTAEPTGTPLPTPIANDANATTTAAIIVALLTVVIVAIAIVLVIRRTKN